MRWLSIDPAKLTGVARWRGDLLVSVATLRPPTPAERKAKTFVREARSSVALDVLTVGNKGRVQLFFLSELEAWGWLLTGAGAVIAEEGFGASPKTVAQHAFRRGFVAALCALRAVPFRVVNVSEWRKVVGGAHGFTFPRDSEQAKARAQELVEPMLGAKPSDDEADAVCAGLWALETRTVSL